MNIIQTSCGNCFFCYNGQCNYAGHCDYSKKWSNILGAFVPINYIEREYLNWEEN